MDEEGADPRQAVPQEAPDGVHRRASATTRSRRGVQDRRRPPVTVVFDRTGKEVKRFAGFLSEPDLLAAVQGAL